MSQPIIAPISWSPARKLGFRFFCLFFFLYILFNPNGVLPYYGALTYLYTQPLHWLIPWIGEHILHLPDKITIFTNGSGDTTYDYVILLFLTVIAVLGCMVWTVLDRHRKNYDQLYYWLTVIVRYYLGITMLSYGFVKIYKLQFPAPDSFRLLETYGQSSPMGLAWTFMGYSKGYNYFTGFMEVSGGLLLLFRRTTAAGSLLTLIVAGHVMALNYCFDIPVKLLSTTLVFMSLYLLSGNIRRLIDLFFFQRTTSLTLIQAPVIRRKWLRYSLKTFKFLLIAYVIFTDISSSAEGMHIYGDSAPKAPLSGIYNIETFIRNKDTIPPLLTDTIRWRQLIIAGSKGDAYVTIRTMNDAEKGYQLVEDTVKHTITFVSYYDSSQKVLFNYRFSGPDALVCNGRENNNDTIRVYMRKYPENKFLLTSRGFHWINEYPMNR
jgi:uncharacterized membrane protein YphA (DoxX/SURF4 family)